MLSLAGKDESHEFALGQTRIILARFSSSFAAAFVRRRDVLTRCSLHAVPPLLVLPFLTDHCFRTQQITYDVLPLPAFLALVALVVGCYMFYAGNKVRIVD